MYDNMSLGIILGGKDRRKTNKESKRVSDLQEE